MGFGPMDNPGTLENKNDPDALLMQEAAGGALDAFSALIRRHQDPLVNFFRRMGVRTESEDLVQETFVRLYRTRERYRPSARFTTYLYVIARNVLADHGRRWFRRERLRESLVREVEAAGVVTPQAGGRMDVEEALGRLSPKLRSVVVLNVYQGLKQDEIAEVLGIPRGTVKSRMNLALRALKEFFDGKR